MPDDELKPTIDRSLQRLSHWDLAQQLRSLKRGLAVADPRNEVLNEAALRLEALQEISI
jgi:hypothetical protein